MSKEDVPEIIYHYTTQEGLLGILNERAIWATKMHYLNDASELIEPFRIGTEELDRLSLLQKENEDKEIVLNLRNSIPYSEAQNYCVVSFCSHGDLLSQWRAYGSFGSAYSIGFNFNKLQQHISAYRFELRRCEYYENKDYQAKIKEFIGSVVTKALSEKSEPRDFMDNFINMAANMKLMCFEDEAEWRIISMGPLKSSDPRYNFRASNSILIPYYSLPIELSVIDEIIVGPCPHPKLSSSTIWGLSYRYKLTNIRKNGIRSSNIPYRTF